MNSIFNFNIKNSKTKKLENKGALEIKNATEDRAELYFYGDIVSNFLSPTAKFNFISSIE